MELVLRGGREKDNAKIQLEPSENEKVWSSDEGWTAVSRNASEVTNIDTRRLKKADIGQR